LISAGGDVVGALAYSLYKQHKVEWTLQYIGSHGAPPDAAALADFKTTNLLPSMISGYLERGQTLAQEFLSAGLQQKVGEIGMEVRQSALALSIQDTLTAQLNEKKTFLGWLRDAGTSIVTNLMH
jgi:hypothetical protein